MRADETPNRDRANRLRKETSGLEMDAWKILRSLPDVRFRRQVPFGPYVLDFFSPRNKLCVEIDGPLHEEADQRKRDAERDRYLVAHGVRTLRFTEDRLGAIERAVAEARRRLQESRGPKRETPPPSHPGPGTDIPVPGS